MKNNSKFNSNSKSKPNFDRNQIQHKQDDKQSKMKLATQLNTESDVRSHLNSHSNWNLCFKSTKRQMLEINTNSDADFHVLNHDHHEHNVHMHAELEQLEKRIEQQNKQRNNENIIDESEIKNADLDRHQYKPSRSGVQVDVCVLSKQSTKSSNITKQLNNKMSTINERAISRLGSAYESKPTLTYPSTNKRIKRVQNQTTNKNVTNKYILFFFRIHACLFINLLTIHLFSDGICTNIKTKTNIKNETINS
jgi:hypothetical protein